MPILIEEMGIGQWALMVGNVPGGVDKRESVKHEVKRSLLNLSLLKLKSTQTGVGKLKIKGIFDLYLKAASQT